MCLLYSLQPYGNQVLSPGLYDLQPYGNQVLSPGLYDLAAPLLVTHPGQVVPVIEYWVLLTMAPWLYSPWLLWLTCTMAILLGYYATMTFVYHGCTYNYGLQVVLGLGYTLYGCTYNYGLQVVLGLGFATLTPRHGGAAVVLAAAGARLAGVLVQAGPLWSRSLVQVSSGVAHGT